MTTVSNPSDWVEKRFALEYLEPTVLGNIISPGAYLSSILELCHSKVTRVQAMTWYSMMMNFISREGSSETSPTLTSTGSAYSSSFLSMRLSQISMTSSRESARATPVLITKMLAISSQSY